MNDRNTTGPDCLSDQLLNGTFDEAVCVPPAAAICTSCGHITYRLQVINLHCGQKPDGRRCTGVYGSAMEIGDWARCSACDGASAAKAACTACQQTGWEYIRDRPRPRS